MSKSSRKKKTKAASSSAATDAAVKGSPNNTHAVREAVESIVIAFVLAFLFRTFEAEAFVIPTGSMAHTLRGAHKDVNCIKCGYRYQASASSEAVQQTVPWQHDLRVIESRRTKKRAALRLETNRFQQNRLQRELDDLEDLWQRHRARDVVSATCPMCRYTMSLDPVPGPDQAGESEAQKLEIKNGAAQLTYNGDRILVSKFDYQFHEPERWDVIVFKFPGDAKMNYIKRLVGLPGETIHIQNGDIYTSRDDQSPAIVRKGPTQVRTMMQLAYDNHFRPHELAEALWPDRWQVWPPGASNSDASASSDGWQATPSDEMSNSGASSTGDQHNTWQVFSVDGDSGDTQWIRYQHFIPSWDDWQDIRDGQFSRAQIEQIRPQLMTDFYGYNTYVDRAMANGPNGNQPSAMKLGIHWVGDLMLGCEVEVKSRDGELLLDLVEAGQHFTATIDVATGQATLSIDGVDGYAPTAPTSLRGPGHYQVELANVDDQLLLWIDGSLVEFDDGTAYDGKLVFGDPGDIQPRSTSEDRGDLAPAGVGSRGASLSVSRLRISRDIYYIADEAGATGHPVTDYDTSDEPIRSLSPQNLARFLSDPTRWSVFTKRRHVKFPLLEDQFFVLGDNSPYSKDGRLWDDGYIGHHVPRELLIGKAVFIYWPHSWGQIPLAPRWVPGWPNFGDMGLVK